VEEEASLTVGWLGGSAAMSFANKSLLFLKKKKQKDF
jgi:hypothetical protein